MRISGFISNVFSPFFCFPFSLPFYFLYLLPFIPLLSTEKDLTSALQKTRKWNIDRLGDLAYSTTNFVPKLDMFFCHSSARIWSIFKIDTRMDGPVPAMLAAYQNNLVSSENDDVRMGQCFPTPTSGKYDS